MYFFTNLLKFIARVSHITCRFKSMCIKCVKEVLNFYLKKFLSLYQVSGTSNHNFAIQTLIQFLHNSFKHRHIWTIVFVLQRGYRPLNDQKYADIGT